jgi:hypothetical protein
MIEVRLEPGELDPMAAERCCFCRHHTRYWYVPKDVACCPECAQHAEPDDVPDKNTWFRRERIAEKRIMG